MSIKSFFFNGKKQKLSKEVLDDSLSASLPPVPTTEDVGKVPVVQDDGSYALATPSSGSNAPLICTDTNDTLDKTMGTIQTASLEGRNIIIISRSNDTSVVMGVDAVAMDKGEACGSVWYIGRNGIPFHYAVSETTEAAALAAYPTIAE